MSDARKYILLILILLASPAFAVPGGGEEEGALHHCLEDGTPPIHTCLDDIHTSDTKDCWNRPRYPICPFGEHTTGQCVEEFGIRPCTAHERSFELDPPYGPGCRFAYQACQDGGTVGCFVDTGEPNHSAIAGVAEVVCQSPGNIETWSCEDDN